eukprot:COSAG01_NODE_4408_length_5059_cov_2.693565_9_plen_87_part_00
MPLASPRLASQLHKRAYQHKTANCLEEMLCDVMDLANDHIKLPGAETAQNPQGLVVCWGEGDWNLNLKLRGEGGRGGGRGAFFSRR